MTANPGRLAQCDHPGCEAELRIYRGQDAQRALKEAGWTWRGDLNLPHVLEGSADLGCPDHPIT